MQARSFLHRIGITVTPCIVKIPMPQEEWYSALLREYAKWVSWQYRWGLVRDSSMKALTFPFSYRPGQKELAASVYRTILREKKIFIEAPTGVGKTISTLFPSVKAFGEGLVEKIFYLTAKTITRTVAEETFRILAKHIPGALHQVMRLVHQENIIVLPLARKKALERCFRVKRVR